MINVFDDGKDFGKQLENALQRSFEYNKPDIDFDCVDLENKGSGLRQDFNGIKQARELAGNGRKVVCYAFTTMPILYLRQNFRELFAYHYDKVRYLKLPFYPNDIIAAFDTPQYENPALFHMTKAEERESLASSLLHSLYREREKNLKIARDELKLDGTDDEVISQLTDIRDARREKRSLGGLYLPGVFCDIEGTFLDSKGNVNEEIKKELEKYALEKPVNLWTGGNSKELSKAVGDVHYPVLNKLDYNDSVIEIAIDNEPQTELEKEYNIKINKFIKV